MSYIVQIAAILQLAFGVYAAALGRNAMNETTAAVAIGFGVVALGIGRLLQYREADEKARAAAESLAKWEAKNIR